VARVRGLAEQLSPAQLSRLWQMLLKALEEAGKAPDPIAAVEMAMVRLCAAQSLPPPEEAARLLRDGASFTAAAANSETKAKPAESPVVNAAPPPPDAAPETPPHSLRSFEDVVTLIARERNIELELALERMKVVHFSPNGDLIFTQSADLPRDLVRNLKPLLEEETGIEWRIRASSETATVESLAERRRAERQRAMDELKRQPFVALALKHFPNAEVTIVREPVEETSGGDVAPFPQKQPPAQQPPRKKEADR
jgi:DNA polymerase-3 subunit gamma/tau